MTLEKKEPLFRDGIMNDGQNISLDCLIWTLQSEDNRVEISGASTALLWTLFSGIFSIHYHL